ncbi:MAG: caspase family protein [Gemmatimonadota bacterium]
MPSRAIRPLLRVVSSLAVIGAMTSLLVSPLSAQTERRGLEQRGGGTTAGKGFGTYHALIFAVGDQQPSSGLPSLKFPIKEADSLRAVITREYTFEPKNVQVVKNPTREAILDSLEAVARRLGPDDNLLVVYSGHGGFDEAGREGYWLAADAANARKSTWIPNESIRTWLRTLKARSVLLITDACFSGSLNRSNDERVVLPADNQRAIAGALLYAQRTSRQAMTAGTAKETVPQVSIFSMEIIAALKARRAPVFMAQQLAGEINPRVAAVARTTPTFSAVPGIESDQGDFVFVRRQSANAAIEAATSQVATASGTTGGIRRDAAGTQGVRQSSVGNVQDAEIAPPLRSQTSGGNVRGSTPAGPTTRPANAGTAGAGTTSSKLGNFGMIDGDGSAPAAGGAATTPATPPRAAPISRAAPGCDGGTSTGCITLGQNLEIGRNGQTRNVPRALGLYRLACDAKDPDGCMHLGRMYDSRFDGVSMDRGKARQLYAQACDLGSAAACTYLGLSASKGEGGPVDVTRAATLFTKACDGAHMQGCALLGAAYATGKGVSQNETRAASLLQRACAVGEPSACATLGTMTASGRGGITRDSVAAIGHWRQACTLAGIAEGCAYLGAGYLRGSGVMHDDVRAGQYLSQGCEGGFAVGCTLLGSMYEKGSAVTAKSITRAAEFYKRGCSGGDAKACQWVTANPQPPAKP